MEPLSILEMLEHCKHILDDNAGAEVTPNDTWQNMKNLFSHRDKTNNLVVRHSQLLKRIESDKD